MRFAIPKNVHLGLNGRTGHLAPRHVGEGQEQRCENVFFQNREPLTPCVLEKRKRRRSVILLPALTGLTGQNGLLAHKPVEEVRRSVAEIVWLLEMEEAVRGRGKKLIPAMRRTALLSLPGVTGPPAHSLVVEESGTGRESARWMGSLSVLVNALVQ